MVSTSPCSSGATENAHYYLLEIQGGPPEDKGTQAATAAVSLNSAALDSVSLQPLFRSR